MAELSLPNDFLFRALLASIAILNGHEVYGQSDKSLSVLFREVNPAVIKVLSKGLDGSLKATGSGFIVSEDGKFVTNFHVVENAEKIGAKLSNGDVYDEVELLAVDRRRDLVVLKLPAIELPKVRLGRSSAVIVGTPVFTVSTPLGSLDNTLSDGLVSGIREVDGYRVFQLTAAISSGSSGGPAFSTGGEVIAVSTATIAGGQSLNFAIPIDYVRGLLAGSLQVKSLDNLKTGDAPVAIESKEATQANHSDAKPPAPPDQMASAVEDIKKIGLTVFLERQFLKWTPDEAQQLLGSPVNHRFGYDSRNTITQDIFSYRDPTANLQRIELAFNKQTKKLIGLYMYPINVTWDACKKLWGEDVRITKNNDGTRFVSYNNRRINVLLNKQGQVLNIGVY